MKMKLVKTQKNDDKLEIQGKKLWIIKLNEIEINYRYKIDWFEIIRMRTNNSYTLIFLKNLWVLVQIRFF